MEKPVEFTMFQLQTRIRCNLNCVRLYHTERFAAQTFLFQLDHICILNASAG